MTREQDGGVRACDMTFDSEPTARSDDKARYLRIWYEANRESWWLRNVSRGPGAGRPPWADDFMTRLMNEMNRIDRIAAKQLASED